MRRSRLYGWGSLVVGLALLASSGGARAQSIDSTARDTARRETPADHLAGRARVALDASASRIDHGRLTSYTMSGSIAPFLGEHLQLGVGPSGELLDSPGGPALSEVGASVIANYVFGGDAHWRGYVGGFGSAAAATHSWSSTQIGAQVGALYFLTPALAIRGEVRRREIMTPTAVRSGFWNVFVTLDPYAFGAASLESIAYPGLGTVDVMGTYAFDWDHGMREGELTGTVAPYLTRWAQVGVDGELLGWSNAPHMHRLRGFGRLYLPLTVRTQPFAESFAETNTLTGATGGLTSYGGELGVRRMLDANVAIDVGVKRELHPAVRFDGFTRHDLGTTALVIGMMTRIGHAH